MAAVLGVLGHGAHARACGPYSHTLRQHVVGVARDGTFVVTTTQDTASSAPSLTVYDADGDQLAYVSRDKPTDAWAVSAEDRDIEHELAPLVGPQDLPAVEAALRAHYHLTPLRRSALSARVPHTADGCDWLRIDTPEGPMPVLDVGVRTGYGNEGCVDVATTLLEHPDSGLMFVRIAYVKDVDGEATDTIDDVRWFPAARLSGARFAERGRRELAAGRPGPALAELDQALTLAPEYLPARLWGMQAMADGHRSAGLARGWRDYPCPETQDWVGGSPAEASAWFKHLAPASWQASAWRFSPECLPRESAPPGTDASDLEPADETPTDETPADELPTIDSSGPTVDVPAPALDAPPVDEPGQVRERSVWWFDPGSTLLGAGAVASFLLARRLGLRTRRGFKRREGWPAPRRASPPPG
ncbi:MAG: hypothetical protein EOO75_09865 [Myxococcales bacterium]|nr:MAG: hypothetical protein EOO75_09865 [Myxococcales bacterium]